jgi:hypothetical protein
VEEVVPYAHKRKKIVLLGICRQKCQIFINGSLSTPNKCKQIVLKPPPILGGQRPCGYELGEVFQVGLVQIPDSEKAALTVVQLVGDGIAWEMDGVFSSLQQMNQTLGMAVLSEQTNRDRYDPFLVRMGGEIKKSFLSHGKSVLLAIYFNQRIAGLLNPTFHGLSHWLVGDGFKGLPQIFTGSTTVFVRVQIVLKPLSEIRITDES